MQLLCIAISAALFVGCAGGPVQTQDTTAGAVYATQSAINANRFDLAKEYSEEATRLLPPPKNPIKVKPITVKRRVQSPAGTAPRLAQISVESSENMVVLPTPASTRMTS